MNHIPLALFEFIQSHDYYTLLCLSQFLSRRSKSSFLHSNHVSLLSNPFPILYGRLERNPDPHPNRIANPATLLLVQDPPCHASHLSLTSIPVLIPYIDPAILQSRRVYLFGYNLIQIASSTPYLEVVPDFIVMEEQNLFSTLPSYTCTRHELLQSFRHAVSLKSSPALSSSQPADYIPVDALSSKHVSLTGKVLGRSCLHINRSKSESHFFLEFNCTHVHVKGQMYDVEDCISKIVFQAKGNCEEIVFLHSCFGRDLHIYFQNLRIVLFGSKKEESSQVLMFILDQSNFQVLKYPSYPPIAHPKNHISRSKTKRHWAHLCHWSRLENHLEFITGTITKIISVQQGKYELDHCHIVYLLFHGPQAEYQEPVTSATESTLCTRLGFRVGTSLTFSHIHKIVLDVEFQSEPVTHFVACPCTSVWISQFSSLDTPCESFKTTLSDPFAVHSCKLNFVDLLFQSTYEHAFHLVVRANESMTSLLKSSFNTLFGGTQRQRYDPYAFVTGHKFDCGFTLRDGWKPTISTPSTLAFLVSERINLHYSEQSVKGTRSFAQYIVSSDYLFHAADKDEVVCLGTLTADSVSGHLALKDSISSMPLVLICRDSENSSDYRFVSDSNIFKYFLGSETHVLVKRFGVLVQASDHKSAVSGELTKTAQKNEQNHRIISLYCELKHIMTLDGNRLVPNVTQSTVQGLLTSGDQGCWVYIHDIQRPILLSACPPSNGSNSSIPNRLNLMTSCILEGWACWVSFSSLPSEMIMKRAFIRLCDKYVVHGRYIQSQTVYVLKGVTYGSMNGLSQDWVLQWTTSNYDLIDLDQEVAVSLPLASKDVSEKLERLARLCDRAKREIRSTTCHVRPVRDWVQEWASSYSEPKEFHERFYSIRGRLTAIRTKSRQNASISGTTLVHLFHRLNLESHNPLDVARLFKEFHVGLGHTENESLVLCVKDEETGHSLELFWDIGQWSHETLYGLVPGCVIQLRHVGFRMRKNGMGMYGYLTTQTELDIISLPSKLFDLDKGVGVLQMIKSDALHANQQTSSLDRLHMTTRQSSRILGDLLQCPHYSWFGRLNQEWILATPTLVTKCIVRLTCRVCLSVLSNATCPNECFALSDMDNVETKGFMLDDPRVQWDVTASLFIDDSTLAAKLYVDTLPLLLNVLQVTPNGPEWHQLSSYLSRAGYFVYETQSLPQHQGEDEHDRFFNMSLDSSSSQPSPLVSKWLHEWFEKKLDMNTGSIYRPLWIACRPIHAYGSQSLCPVHEGNFVSGTAPFKPIDSVSCPCRVEMILPRVFKWSKDVQPIPTVSFKRPVLKALNILSVNYVGDSALLLQDLLQDIKV